MRQILTLLLSLTFSAAGPAFAQSASDILAQSDERRTIDDMSFEVGLSAYDGNQVTDTTTLWGYLKVGGDHNRVLMYFVDPASARGRKLLVDGDAVYLLFVRTSNPIRLSPLEVLTGQASDGDVVRTFARDYDVESMTGESLDGVAVYRFTRGKAVRWRHELQERPAPGGEIQPSASVRGVLRRVGRAFEKVLLPRLQGSDGEGRAVHRGSPSQRQCEQADGHGLHEDWPQGPARDRVQAQLPSVLESGAAQVKRLLARTTIVARSRSRHGVSRVCPRGRDRRGRRPVSDARPDTGPRAPRLSKPRPRASRRSSR